MHNKQTLALTGIGMLGAAVLLAGCGGSSLSQNNLGTRPSTLPYVYGIEPVAFYGAANLIGAQAALEGSGFQAATGGQAYITDATAFTIVKATDTTGKTATLPTLADPNGTGSLPFGFSTKGQYVDANVNNSTTPAPVTAMPAGTSVFFRAAIANGVAANTSPGITSATLTSTDPQFAAVPGLTAGLPMGLNPVGGAFSNATYSTGTTGTPVPFTIPASTTTGLHTVTCTVTDAAGRVTATTFGFPVLAGTDAAVLAGIVGTVPADLPKTDAATVVSATATISSPVAGAVAQTTADVNQNVLLFTAPGAQTITATATVVITDLRGATVSTLTQTGTLPVTTTAGGTISDAVVTVAGTTAAPTGSAIQRHILHHS